LAASGRVNDVLDGELMSGVDCLIDDMAARGIIISLSNTLQRVARALKAAEALTEDALDEVMESFAELAELGGTCNLEICHKMHSIATCSAFVKVGQLLMDAGEVAPAGLHAAEKVVFWCPALVFIYPPLSSI
jgi:hypothetical protein